MKQGGNRNNNNKYNRNRSFGGSGTGNAPHSPKKQGGRGGGGHQKQPARRSASHDPKEPFLPDDDGFTTIGGNKKKGGGGGGNRFNDNNNNNNGPRGRMNPTSSFSRPRNNNNNHHNNNNNNSDRNKPRHTGSFKKGRDNRHNNNHNNNNSSSNLHNSTGSFDGLHHGHDSRNNMQRRANSFHKQRNQGSFNAKNGTHNYNNNNNNRNNNNNNNENNNNNAANNAAAKRELYRRSTSRLTAYDVELYTQGDGKSPAQRGVVRIHVDVMMRARLSNLDTPVEAEQEQQNDPPNVDVWHAHHKCLWSDPTRPEQIQQIMTKYPNAIPLHLKKRTRIKSSKLGDSTVPGAASSAMSACASVMTASDDGSERDDISLGASVILGGGGGAGMASDAASVAGSVITAPGVIVVDDEDMNPLRKTLMLLNKLSWTTIDKLTPMLFQILEEDVPKLMPPTSILGTTVGSPTAAQQPAAPPPPAQEEVLPMVMTILTMIVEKSQTEPHFSAMYAQLCKNLAERNKAWKKKILAHCQSEFEHDTAWHICRLDERLEAKAAALAAGGGDGSKLMDDASTNTSNTTATEDMDREYQVLQLRKKYKGHVQFLGELFKLGLIKLDIMIWCMSRLLFHKEAGADEDDLECFAKLMTVVGEQAESLVKKGKCHERAEEKWYECWDRVYLLTGKTKTSSSSANNKKPTGKDDGAPQPPSSSPPPKISSRIKFMLVDLLELQENGWVHRRQQEQAKTISEIHEEVREEEAAALRRSYSDDWGGSSSGGFGSNRRRVNSDDYGSYFSSSSSNNRPQKDADGFMEIPKRSNVRRAKSDMDMPDLYNRQQQQQQQPIKKKKPPTPVPSSPTNRSRVVISQIDVSNATPKIVEYPDPEECRNKTKTILKEYFIGGDTKDAILSIDELVGAGRDNEGHGSVERGAAVIEAGVLLVLEMKQQEVQKFLAVIKRCLQQKKLENASLPLGLKDPLEFLSDIEIDAPLARSLLTSIVAYWVRQEVLPFNFLLNSPEYFRTDGKPAEFAAGVLKVRGGAVSDEDMSVVEQLMTDDDKTKYSSVKEMVKQEE